MIYTNPNNISFFVILILSEQNFYFILSDKKGEKKCIGLQDD